MSELDTRYRLRPSFSVVAHSADVVELRRGVWNPVSITLTDRSGSGKLSRALDLMTGERTLGEVAERTQLSVKEAGDLVAFLSRHDAVETDPSNAFDFALGGHGDSWPSMEASAQRVRSVVLLGADLADGLTQALDDFEAKLRFRLYEQERVERLMETDFTLSEDPLTLWKDLATYEEWKDSFVVCAAQTVHPILLRNVNRICLHHRVPWMHVAADGPFLIIGPTFVPGKSPCYECFETRVALNIRESESYGRYKRALVDRAVKIGKPYLTPPFRSVLTSLAALEIANMTATGSNFTIGKALAVYLPTLEFSFNEVLRAPGCAACSPITEQHEQGLYFDLKGYVNSMYGD